MFSMTLRCAHRIDAWLRRRLGPPYHVILGIGLVIEIIRHVRELVEVGASPRGMIGIVLLLVFYVVLLVHQLGELEVHLAHRR